MNEHREENASTIFRHVTKDRILVLSMDALDFQGKDGPSPRLKVRCGQYDLSRPAGERMVGEVPAFIPTGRFLVLAHDVLSGRIPGLRRNLEKAGKLEPGTTFFTQYGGSAPAGDRPCISRRLALVPGKGTASFAFLATSGPGVVQPDGLILPRAGVRPDRVVYINLDDAVLKEFLLVGRMYIEQYTQILLRTQLEAVHRWRGST